VIKVEQPKALQYRREAFWIGKSAFGERVIVSAKDNYGYYI
jgi:hypothetical protein